MSAARCFYAFHNFRTPGWDDWATPHSPGSLGLGLTDTRFAVPVVMAEQAGLRLSYNATDKPCLTAGQYLPPDYAARWQAPVQVKLTGGRVANRSFPKQPHDNWPNENCPCVSARVRDIIEQVEPGRHQFIPVRAVTWDTREELFDGQEFYLLNILNWIAPDALLDIAAMDPAHYRHSGADRFGEIFMHQITAPRVTDLVIRSEWLDSGHLIRTGRYQPRPTLTWGAQQYAFMSDTLHDALESALPRGIVPSRRIRIGPVSPYWRMVLNRSAEAWR